MTITEIVALINAGESLGTLLLPDLIKLFKQLLTSDSNMTIGEFQALAQDTFDSNKEFYEDWMAKHSEVQEGG